MTPVIDKMSDLKVTILRSAVDFQFYHHYKKYISINPLGITGDNIEKLRNIRDLERLNIVKKLPTNVAVCGILRVGNRIICVKRKDQEAYGFIGGKVDEQDPTIFSGLLREVREETGFQVNIEHSRGYYIAEDSSGYLTVCALLTLQSSGHTSQKEGEVPFLYLLSKEQLLQHSAFKAYNEEALKFFNI